MRAAEFASVSSPALLLVNPQASGGRGAGTLSEVRGYFATQGFPVEVVETATEQELVSCVRSGLAAGRRLFIAMGGDGTVQGLANETAGRDAALGIIPVGGGNDFAKAAGLPRDPVAAAEVIVSGAPRPMDLLRARTADGRARWYCGGGGVGLDADTVQYSSGPLRRLPGALRYAAGALLALRGFAPLEISAEFPCGEHPPKRIRALLAAVLNTPTYGAGLRLAPRAIPDDGQLDVVLVESLKVLEVLDVLPRLVSDDEVRLPQISRLRARAIRLSASRPAMFHGDGEILGPLPVEVEVSPHAVRVMTR